MFKATMGRKTNAACGARRQDHGREHLGGVRGADDNAVVDGDFAVAESELSPVLVALRGGGINIVAIHHHMSGETPRILFLHYWGRGKAADLAGTVRKALDLTAWKARPRVSDAREAPRCPVRASPTTTAQLIVDIENNPGITFIVTCRGRSQPCTSSRRRPAS